MLPVPTVENVFHIMDVCQTEIKLWHMPSIYTFMRKTALRFHASISNYFVKKLMEEGKTSCTKEVFNKMVNQDPHLWNILIVDYVKNGEVHCALEVYKNLQRNSDMYTNKFAFVSLLKACISLQDIETGQKIHADIARKGSLETDVFIGSTLVNMYAKCGFMSKAKDVFRKQQVQNVVLWTAIIAAYAEHGLFLQVFDSIEEMKQQSILLDAYTFVFILKACGCLQELDKGREIHAEIFMKGLLETDCFLGSILVDMYAKCGRIREAEEVFQHLPKKDTVTWTALVAGYMECGLDDAAVNCFNNMQTMGISATAVTFVSVLNACANVGAVTTGREIHTKVFVKGLENELFLGNSLIDVYMKLGFSIEAQAVFDKLPIKDAVSWTALVTGYGLLEQSEDIYAILEKMTREGVQPDLVTFRTVLNACSHSGSIYKAEQCFTSIMNHCYLLPRCEHYNCLVDLFGRAGHIDKAMITIERMPFQPNIVAWYTILGACQCLKNMELGRHAFQHALQLDEKHTAAYVSMCNIYVNAAVHDVAFNFEQL